MSRRDNGGWFSGWHWPSFLTWGGGNRNSGNAVGTVTAVPMQFAPKHEARAPEIPMTVVDMGDGQDAYEVPVRGDWGDGDEVRADYTYTEADYRDQTSRPSAQVFANQAWVDRAKDISRHSSGGSSGHGSLDEDAIRTINVTLALANSEADAAMSPLDFFIRLVLKLSGAGEHGQVQVSSLLTFYQKAMHDNESADELGLGDFPRFMELYHKLQEIGAGSRNYMPGQEMKEFVTLCRSVGLRVEGSREFREVYESQAETVDYEEPHQPAAYLEPDQGAFARYNEAKSRQVAEEMYEELQPVEVEEINHPVVIVDEADEEEFDPVQFVYREATAEELAAYSHDGKVNMDLVRSVSGRRLFPKAAAEDVHVDAVYDMGSAPGSQQDGEAVYDMGSAPGSQQDGEAVYDMGTFGQGQDGQPVQPLYDMGTFGKGHDEHEGRRSQPMRPVSASSKRKVVDLNDSGRSGSEASSTDRDDLYGFEDEHQISLERLKVFVRVPKQAPQFYDPLTMSDVAEEEDTGYLQVLAEDEKLFAVADTLHPSAQQANVGSASSPFYFFQAGSDGNYQQRPEDDFPKYESLDAVMAGLNPASRALADLPPPVPEANWAEGYRAKGLISSKEGDENAPLIDGIIALINDCSIPELKSGRNRTALMSVLAIVIVLCVITIVVGKMTNWFGFGGDEKCVSDAEAKEAQKICLSALQTLKAELQPGSYNAVTTAIIQLIYNALSPAQIAALPGLLSTQFNEQSMVAHLRETCPLAVVESLCSWDNGAYPNGLTGLSLPSASGVSPVVTFDCPVISVNQYAQVAASQFLPSEVLHGATSVIIFKDMTGARVETSAGPVAAVSGEFHVPANQVGDYFIKVTGHGTPSFKVAHVIDPTQGNDITTEFDTCQISAAAVAPPYSMISQTGGVSGTGAPGQQLTYSAAFSTSAPGVTISGRVLKGLPVGAQVTLSDASIIPITNNQAALPATGIFHVEIPNAGSHSLSLVPCVTYSGGQSPHCYDANPTVLTAVVVAPSSTQSTTPAGGSSSVAPGSSTPPGTTTTMRLTTPSPTASSSSTTTVPDPVVSFTCPAMTGIPEDNAVLATQYTSAISVTNGVVANYKFTPSPGISFYHSGSPVAPVNGVVTIPEGQQASYSIRASLYGNYTLGVATDVTRSDSVVVSTQPETCSLNFAAVAPAYGDITQSGSLTASGVDGDFLSYNTAFSVASPDSISGRVLKQIPAGSVVRLADSTSVSIVGGEARLPATGDFQVQTPVGDHAMTLSPCVNYGGQSEHCYTQGVSLQANMAPTTTTTSTVTTTPPPAVVSMSCPSVTVNEGVRQALNTWVSQMSVQNGNLHSAEIQALNGLKLYRNGVAQAGSSFSIPVAEVGQWQVGTPSGFDFGTKSMQIRPVATDLRGQQVAPAYQTCSMTFNAVASPITWSGTTSYTGPAQSWITVTGTVNLATGESLTNIALASSVSGLQTQSLSINPNGQFSWQFKSNSQASYSPSLVATVDYDGPGSATPQQHSGTPRVLSLLFNAPCLGDRCRRDIREVQQVDMESKLSFAT